MSRAAQTGRPRRATLRFGWALLGGGLWAATALLSPEPLRAQGADAVPAAPDAAAASPDALAAQLGQLEAQVGELETSLTALATPVAAPAAEAGAAPAPSAGAADDGAQRLREARTLLAGRNDAAAAPLLWELVERGPQAPAHGDALFLLAESLTRRGDTRTALRLFGQLAALTPAHPRLGEALVQILELSLRTQSAPDDARARDALARLEQLPAGSQPPGAPYTRGKYLYLRDQPDAALPVLGAIEPASPFYVRARYLIGAAQVHKGQLAEAEATFRALVALPLPVADDDRRVRELAHMALGRIYHARGDAAKAHEAYLHISQKSDLFRDALYEAAWAALRAKDFPRAEQALELVLLAYRDAPEVTLAAAEARMLLGNLLLRRGEPDLALPHFTQARIDLEPAATELGRLLGRTGDAAATERLRDLLERDLRATTGTLAGAQAAPILRADPAVRRLLSLRHDAAEIKRTLDEMEAALGSLDGQLGGQDRYRAAPSLGAPRARAHALFRQVFALHQAAADPIDTQLTALATPDEAAQMQATRDRRAALAKAIGTGASGLDALDASSATRREHAELLQREQSLWTTLLVRWAPGETQRQRAEAALAVLGRLAALDGRLGAISGRLDRALDVQLGDAQQKVAAERDKLRGYRQELEGLSRDTARVGGGSLLEAGQQVAKQLGEVLTRADAGTIDVAWARKVSSTDRAAQLVKDEKRELRMLDDEFQPAAEARPAAKPAAKGGEPAASPAVPGDMPADVAEDYRRYLEAAQSYRDALNELGQAGYKARRVQVAALYTQQIQAEEREERARRVQAIALFEQFLGKHPAHARFSPDAMFRLAELYFERSTEEYIAAAKRDQSGEGGEAPAPVAPAGKPDEKDEDGEDATDKAAVAVKKPAADAGALPAAIGATPDYGPSVALYQKLLRDYPGYRNIDGANYLLGYCLGEMGREDEAKQAFLGLVCENKYRPLDAPVRLDRAAQKGDPYAGCQPRKGDSRFLAETWTRIGEHHFDRGELGPALASYTNVMAYPESPYFDKALYKLAWTQYRADRYAEAVKRFDELVVLADKRRGAGKEGSTLRNEAVQYLALSFAERDWNGDGKDDPESGLQRAEQYYAGRFEEPHVREVIRRLGDLWFERTEFARAAEVWQAVIKRWPMAADNPKLQERVVAAYDRLRSFEQALRAREALAKDYLPGGPWYEKNRDNPAALDEAAELADASLMAAVMNRHSSAQALREKATAKKDAKLMAQAAAEYAQAADSYALYLKKNPNSKSAYEYSYLLAESLFYAGRFAEAAREYERVRDMDPAGKYREDAAYAAIKANEEVVAALYRNGTAEPPLPAVGKTQVNTGAGGRVDALPLPDEVAKLQAAYDRYVALLPASERGPLLSYKAAEIDFRYLRFPTARTRFAQILDSYCKDERAVDAGNALLVSFTIESDLDRIEEWTQKIKAKGCGSGTKLAAQQQGELKKLSGDVRFKKAEQLLERKQYEPAAQMFVQIVDSDPKAPSADKALNNAAVAYESLKRYGAATALYERIVSDYPSSPFVDEALFRAAVNHQRFFEFDKAAAAYKALATEARFKESSHRHDALYNAALILENDQRYAQAAELWQRYAADAKTSPDGAFEAAFRAALSVEKQGNSERAAQELSSFIRRYGKDARGAEAVGRIVEAYFRLGRAQLSQRSSADAAQSLQQAARLGSQLTPGSDAAEYAAQAAFQLAERRLADIEAKKIGGSGRELEASITDFNKKVGEAVSEYDKVLGYKRATWTLAAYFRMGYVFELYAKALLAAPCPPEVKRLGAEACDLYRNQIEENVSSIEEKAASRYAVTLEQAGRLGVANQWTRLARVRANAYRPEQFPLVKDERVSQQLDADGIAARGAPRGSGSGGSGDAAKLTGEARGALAQGQVDSALVLARSALAKDDRFVPAMLVLARVYYETRKYELAAAVLGIAQAIEPAEPQASAEADVLLGFLALQRDDRIAATAAFKKATEVDPSSGIAWHNLAAQYLNAKNYPQALEAAQRAVTLLPGSAGALLNLGSALRGQKRFTEALDAYRRVLDRDPQSIDGHYDLGVLYLDGTGLAGDPIAQKQTAITYLSRAAELAQQRGTRDEAAEACIREARTAIEREQRKQQKKRP